MFKSKVAAVGLAFSLSFGALSTAEAVQANTSSLPRTGADKSSKNPSDAELAIELDKKEAQLEADLEDSDAQVQILVGACAIIGSKDESTGVYTPQLITAPILIAAEKGQRSALELAGIMPDGDVVYGISTVIDKKKNGKLVARNLPPYDEGQGGSTILVGGTHAVKSEIIHNPRVPETESNYITKDADVGVGVPIMEGTPGEGTESFVKSGLATNLCRAIAQLDKPGISA